MSLEKDNNAVEVRFDDKLTVLTDISDYTNVNGHSRDVQDQEGYDDKGKRNRS